MNTKHAVLYHGKCYDGFGSAFAAWKHFGNEAEYFPVAYNKPLPEKFRENKWNNVFILDFSYKYDILKWMKEKVCNHIVLLDHHHTAEQMLEPLIDVYDWLDITFDMNKSGALLSWEYFHAGEVPDLIKYISDRDLWRFEYEHTEAVHKALVSYPMDFELWESFLKEDRFDELIREGTTLKKMYDQLVNNICEGAWVGKLDDQNIPMVNTSIAWSEVGHRLLEMYPQFPFAASFTVFDDLVMWSLRSRKNEDVDVSIVAEKFGGGGHKNAAGFKVPKV